MRRFLLLLAALLGLVSGAQAQTTAQKLVLLSGKILPAVDLNFTTGVRDSRMTFARLSTATGLLYTSTSGTYNTIGLNTPRFISGLGLLIEEARTQSLGVTDTPATQTVTLATGTYSSWMIGSGSVTSSAGTAVGSGFGAATQGVPNTITITTGGTVVFTVAGAVTRFQCELGAFPTSYIPNSGAAGTTAARAADVATMTLASIGIPANPMGLTIIGKTAWAAGSDGATAQRLLTIDDGSASNRLFMERASTGTNVSAQVTTAGVSQAAMTLTGAPSANQPFSFWFGAAQDNFAAQIVGNAKGADVSGSMPGGLTTLRLGVDNFSGKSWNSTIARLQIYNRRLSDAQAAAIAASL